MEKVVYIHGVVPEGTRSHTSDYRDFRDGLTVQLTKRRHDPLPALEDSVTVEWGFSHKKAGNTASLAKAQAVIARKVDAATPKDRTSISSLLFAPAIEPVRGLIQHTWADIVYYISEKGKARVRDVVWGEVLTQADPEQPLDLTIFGHSAGSLIAIDFLFWLFSGKREHDELAESAGVGVEAVEQARKNWRLRRLVTFGSPISALAIRSVDVAELIAKDKKLRLRDIGFGRKTHDGHDALWLNVWDRHDVLAYPVAPFYKGGHIEDLYPDHSDSLLGSHHAYWRAVSVHRILAERWNAAVAT